MDFLFIFFACALIACIAVSFSLYYLNSIPSKSLNDVQFIIPKINSGPITSPVVYQFDFISSDASSNVWTFAKQDVFVADWKANKINTLLMSGALFSVTSVTTTDTTMAITMKSDCNETVSFVGCASIGSQDHMMTYYVLGYRF